MGRGYSHIIRGRFHVLTHLSECYIHMGRTCFLQDRRVGGLRPLNGFLAPMSSIHGGGEPPPFYEFHGTLEAKLNVMHHFRG